MPLSTGTRLGPYEVLELTGTGGMGDVYKARDTRLGRTVALKTLKLAGPDDGDARVRFAREARAIAALNHPRICAIHDVGQWDGHDCIVMEFLEGETLQQRLARGPLPLDQVLTIGIEVAAALTAAHRAGIVHRDLKPSNVMLTRGGVKLLDFGIARQTDSVNATLTGVAAAAPLTIEGTFVGTLPYMSPEQLEGRPVDTRSDIFAFGAVLFEMATGRRAFAGESFASVVAGILGDTRPRPSDIKTGLPKALDRIISVCLARDPDERWQHTADLLRELKWLQHDWTDPETAAATGGAASLSRKRWLVHGLWAAALVVCVAMVWVAAGRARAELPPPNPQPVIVLMDSPLPGRVYDPRTAEAGGTNADDVTDALGQLPVVLRKENTSAVWHREAQVVAEKPDLIVSHLSCLLDARVAGDQRPIHDHLYDLAENRLLLFFAYVAAANPRTRFIVYSRSGFQRVGGEAAWVSGQVARLPVLKDRLHAFIVPGANKATFRDPTTASLLRARVIDVLGLPR